VNGDLAGHPSMLDGEPRQVRKEAAVTIDAGGGIGE